MPSGGYGTVLEVGDIEFGAYYPSTTQFQSNDNWDEASMVVTSRLSENANPVSSLLLRLVGFNTFDVRSEAVFINGDVPCLGAGFYAEGRVDMQSNNDFTDGFCVRSNSRVEFNNNNTFESDPTLEYPVIVSMPTLGDLVIPSSGWNKNPGLYDARREGSHEFNVDTFITDVIAGIFSTDQNSTTNPYTRSYITDTDPSAITYVTVGSSASGGSSSNGNGNGKGKGKKSTTTTTTPIGPNNCPTFEAACLVPNTINVVDCGGSDLNFPAEMFENVVVHTTCNLDFANGTEVRNATLITTSTDDRSISSPQGLDLGDMATCGGTGGATLITRGGMKTAAKMQLLGGQIIAAGDVNFAAQADGFVGASVIAGGEIDGTSNSSFQGCEGSANIHNFFWGDPQPARMAY